MFQSSWEGAGDREGAGVGEAAVGEVEVVESLRRAGEDGDVRVDGRVVMSDEALETVRCVTGGRGCASPRVARAGRRVGSIVDGRELAERVPSGGDQVRQMTGHRRELLFPQPL